MRQKKKLRVYNYRIVRPHYSYDFHEIADLFEIKLRTVQLWQKRGLVVQKDKKPFYVNGENLIAFIKSERQKKRFTLKADEFYCKKCRIPKKGLRGSMQIELTNIPLGKSGFKIYLRSTCEKCGKKMIRFTSQRQIDEFRDKGYFV